MTTEGFNLNEDYRPPPWPEDFGKRLEGLKRRTRLRWKEFAARLGVTDREVLQWRRGNRRPSRTSYLAIMALARELPGGYDLMSRDDGDNDADSNLHGNEPADQGRDGLGHD